MLLIYDHFNWTKPERNMATDDVYHWNDSKRFDNEEGFILIKHSFIKFIKQLCEKNALNSK